MADGPRPNVPGPPPAGADAMPSPAELARIAEHLRARAPALRARPAEDVARALGRVGARFLDEGDPLRRRALEQLPEAAGLSAPMARAVLDGMARDWTEERLMRTVAAELGEPSCLDGLTEVVAGGRPGAVEAAGREGGADESGLASTRRIMAVGPSLCVQIVSGSVPGVGVNALLRSLLVKAPTLIKPGRGDELLPTLFAEALREDDPGLADALAVVYWPGGSTGLEEVALAAAEVAVLYGSDETVETLRARVPATTRVVAYHHRIGVGVVGREPTSPAHAVASRVARSVALFEQRGCVCPQLLFVEEGGEVSPADFAGLVADALHALEHELPSPPSSIDAAGPLQQLRGTAEMQAAAGSSVEVRHGGTDAPWTVIFEREPVSGPVGTARTVRIRPIADMATIAEAMGPLGPHLQSIGYAGLGERAGAVAEALGRAGASRVTPFGALPFPPPWWLHDGRGPLRDLVRWVELEV